MHFYTEIEKFKIDHKRIALEQKISDEEIEAITSIPSPAKYGAIIKAALINDDGIKEVEDAIFNLLFKERIEERDRKIKAMNVDELIENLHNENGYGKFIVLEMKERYDLLDDGDKLKILDTLSETTKGNRKWAEGKRRKLDADK